MEPLALAVDCVATYRLTRLATVDVITRPLRGKVIQWAYRNDERLGREATAKLVEHGVQRPTAFWDDQVHFDDDPPKLAVLVTCRWCSGMWVAGCVVLARNIAPARWGPVAKVLALSAAAALISGLERN